MSRRLLAALLVLPLLGCAAPSGNPANTPAAPSAPQTSPAAPDASAAQWTITLVRHADPAPDGTDDPPLSPAGEERAQRLAGLLAAQQGSGVLASGYRRTQQTAAATAAAWGVPVETYDATAPAQDILVDALTGHPSGALLIVGHSNTVPELVAALCGCEVDPIPETEFGVLHRLTLDAEGNLLDRVVEQY